MGTITLLQAIGVTVIIAVTAFIALVFIYNK